MAFNPSGSTAYVTNSQSGTVSVISTLYSRVTAAISVGQEPVAVAVSGLNGLVYVANASSNTVSVFDPSAGNAIVGTVNVAGTPVAVAVDPVTGYAYVADINGNTVAVIAVPRV